MRHELLAVKVKPRRKFRRGADLESQRKGESGSLAGPEKAAQAANDGVGPILARTLENGCDLVVGGKSAGRKRREIADVFIIRH